MKSIIIICVSLFTLCVQATDIVIGSLAQNPTWVSGGGNNLIARFTSVSPGNDSYTKLLLHCDGANGGTNFPDSSASANNVTTIGTAQNTTAVKKFGTAALLLDGNSDYITVPKSSNFYFSTNAFTWDFWEYRNVAQAAYVFSVRLNGSQFFGLYQDAAGGFIVQSFSTWGTMVISISCPYTAATGVWYHVAVVRLDGGDSSNSWRVFVNGTNKTITTDMPNWSAAFPDPTNYLAIGRNGDSDTSYFAGNIDELRISKGIARWTNNFTPPTQSYGE